MQTIVNETTAGGILKLTIASAVESIELEIPATKAIINGQLIIRNGDKVYNVLGTEL